jgi:hypothetical protein
LQGSKESILSQAVSQAQNIMQMTPKVTAISTTVHEVSDWIAQRNSV